MSDPYIGEIRMFGGSYAPLGWLFCQGQLLQISEYDTLFALIGTTYGGDGQETFALPNLQSRVPMHVGQNFPLGQIGGAETVTLTTTQLPVHTHAPVGSATAQTPSPNGAFWAAYANQMYSDQPPVTPMAPNALSVSGGSQPHENMPPYLAINFIISLYGIYPPQN